MCSRARAHKNYAHTIFETIFICVHKYTGATHACPNTDKSHSLTLTRATHQRPNTNFYVYVYMKYRSTRRPTCSLGRSPIQLVTTFSLLMPTVRGTCVARAGEVSMYVCVCMYVTHCVCMYACVRACVYVSMHVCMYV
jgi:hypothetical protein